jgi:hypothetical protein
MNKRKNNSAVRVAFLFAALSALAPSFARAQSVDTSKPITIKPAKPAKPVTFVGQVVSSNAQSITVRSLENPSALLTFSYSDAIRDKMQQLFSQGGYQFGDKVTISTQPGSNVALQIKGKPSKPL